ncbi:MAG: DUF29 family protein [Sphaerospermopsis kisseleviana]|jgi:hypothetical protein|uniref:DUF29 domain-containing protein n=2 Tax=Sphaerospermopsis TaxID=752201 RepID=A0A480A3F2_9CYAN|nr:MULTISPECIES: DUF29 family protein [Sphaerospermopsis]MBC5794277.1 DUF29 family protein [Sphaerospermopsis sp. LEGE 00249]MBE9238468.1 DUF29 family protein [Sphaerospermopsis aphanizomenoides LEGE 00250]MEB3151025.1 DUF29 family protein [Sphaerospermopsis sp.]GCL39495.1 protein of unknown function DUF29 [Sphaerospermopsis reniformis]
MTQELIDLRNSILEQRYTDALAIVDELEGMSRQAIFRNIQSFLVRLIIHLIKNQIEKRLTNSWANSIRGSVREIKKINLQDNKTSYYVKIDEWQPILEDEFEEAIRDASEEVINGIYSPFQLTEMVDKEQIIEQAENLLRLTYNYSVKELPAVIDNYLTQLPGGENWKLGKK